MNARKVVVIGSGPGGSGMAALMAHGGDKVTLLEKNGFIGGKCSALEQDGYIVDTGVHMFGQGPNGPFGKIASMVGEKLDWCLREPMIDFFYSGKGPMHVTHDPFNPIFIKSFLNVNLRGWMKPPNLFKDMHRIFKNYTLKELANIFKKLSNPYTPYLTEFEDVTVKEFFASITDSRDFLRSMHAQTMITMVIPWDNASLADFFYIQFGTVRNRGFGYPAGGSGEIPKTFLRGFEKNGGTIRTGTEVKSINVEKGHVKGVTTVAGEFIPADIVVSNAGIHRTIDLAGEKNFPKEYTARAAELKMSCAFIATKYFLDTKVTSMMAPCMFHCPDLDADEMFAYLETGEIPRDLYLFITVPSMSDPSLAPLGKDILIVGVPAPSDLSRVQQCEELLDLAEHIAERRLFPEIKGHIIKKQRTHIAQTSGLTGRRTGECIGLAQEVGQTGTKKPTPQTPIKGLYLVGSDAGGKGIGTECAADSALYLYNILK